MPTLHNRIKFLQGVFQPVKQIVFLFCRITPMRLQVLAVFYELFFFYLRISLGIDFCCCYRNMTKEITYIDQVHTSLQKMHCLAVSKRVTCNLFCEVFRMLFTHSCNVFIDDVLYSCTGELFTFAIGKHRLIG